MKYNQNSKLIYYGFYACCRAVQFCEGMCKDIDQEMKLKELCNVQHRVQEVCVHVTHSIQECRLNTLLCEADVTAPCGSALLLGGGGGGLSWGESACDSTAQLLWGKVLTHVKESLYSHFG